MKKVLLTGRNGFLGKHICSFLVSTGVEVFSLGRNKYNNIIADLSCSTIFIEEEYDTVIHSAGKAHSVPKTKNQKKEFFDVNVTGTTNLLKGLENIDLPKSFIFISSVSVYGLVTGTSITENYPLLANDPYGKSKIEAERLVWNWCEKNKIICTILRLPLVADSNPPGNLKAMINGIKKGYYFNIADGKARKSMVLAKDIAKIIPVVANIGGIYNLTDGYHPSFSELSQVIAKQLGKSKPLNISMWMANLIAKAGDLVGPKAPINSNKLSKITSDLTFDDSKAQQLLGWKPTSVLKDFKIR